jgi:glycerol-3-phosphate dehydrogenase subunit B
VKVGVIGGGIAGTAAAWAARRAGADVTVSIDRPGASSLYAGALDFDPWGEGREGPAADPDLLAFAMALEAWAVGPQSVRIATHDGVLRPARGLDSALLDVASLEGRTVSVAAIGVEGWDASAMARALGAAPWARRTGTRFEAVRVDGAVEAHEAQGSCFDVALLHDAPARVARLAECLVRASGDAEAWLLGPWLGTAPGVAERLRGLLGKACGETTSPPGGPAGARFEAARDVLFSSLGVHVRREHVWMLQSRGPRWLPMAEAIGAETANDTGFDSVVLATGGLIGGGIALEDGGEPARVMGFRSSVVANVQVGFNDRVLDPASSLHGVDLGALGMRALDCVGILSDAGAARGAERLFVAGDCMADRPRTALAAARSGILAARRALTR